MTATAGTANPPQDPAMPSVEEYRLLLDLRDRAENYLERAVIPWFAQAKAAGIVKSHQWSPDVRTYDDETITIAYSETASDAYDFIEVTHDIPIAEILPEFAERQQVLKILTGGAR